VSCSSQQKKQTNDKLLVNATRQKANVLGGKATASGCKAKAKNVGLKGRPRQTSLELASQGLLGKQLLKRCVCVCMCFHCNLILVATKIQSSKILDPIRLEVHNIIIQHLVKINTCPSLTHLQYSRADANYYSRTQTVNPSFTFNR